MFATTRIWLSSIAYNTSLVKLEDAPKSFADLLDPKWVGKMVKGHPAYSGTIMTATYQVIRELGWDYLEKLSKQRVMQVQSSTDPPKKLSSAARCPGSRQQQIRHRVAGRPARPSSGVSDRRHRRFRVRLEYSRPRRIPTPHGCFSVAAYARRQFFIDFTRNIRFTRGAIETGTPENFRCVMEDAARSENDRRMKRATRGWAGM